MDAFMSRLNANQLKESYGLPLKEDSDQLVIETEAAKTDLEKKYGPINSSKLKDYCEKREIYGSEVL